MQVTLLLHGSSYALSTLSFSICFILIQIELPLSRLQSLVHWIADHFSCKWWHHRSLLWCSGLCMANNQLHSNSRLLSMSSLKSSFVSSFSTYLGHFVCLMIGNIFTSWQLTLRRVMDTAKHLTKSGSLNEVSMVLLNNMLSLPFAIVLILMFNEWEYVINS